MLLYLSTCPDPLFKKFGTTIKQRVENVETFFKSKEFKVLLKKPGGSVLTKRELNRGLNYSKKIKDKKIRSDYYKIYKKIRRVLKNSHVALLARLKSKREMKFTFNIILFHEWIHVLLIKNRIYFQNIKKSYWELDEGLTTYLENFANNKIDRIKKGLPGLNGLSKIYYSNAKKWHNILKNAKTPKERKKRILNFYRKLKTR